LHQALRRHEEQAASSSQSITKLSEDLQKLTLENAKLTEQRDCLTQNCEEMAHNLKNLQLDVKAAHDTNKKLEEQVRAQ
jgi:predicted RNase H-like nuclease (RuvC/YqgF family)